MQNLNFSSVIGLTAVSSVNWTYLLIGGGIALVLVYILITYNSLIRQRNMTQNQKSQIDIQLQRRFDLIPNLVEVVKGYATHEKSTLEAVVNARNQYVSAGNNTADALNADGQLTTALSRLFVLTESYPDLMANQNFLNLQKELSDTENKVAFSRQFYNDAVYKLNTMIEVFPANIVASLFGFKKEQFFETGDTERKNVKINL